MNSPDVRDVGWGRGGGEGSEGGTGEESFFFHFPGDIDGARFAIFVGRNVTENFYLWISSIISIWTICVYVFWVPSDKSWGFLDQMFS